MYVFISRSFPGIEVGQDPLALSLSLSRSLSLSLFALLCSGLGAVSSLSLSL